MKLHVDRSPGLNLFTSHGTGHVTINGVRHEGKLLVMPDRIVSAWTTNGFEHLDAADFAAVAALGPRIVLLGTGDRQRFPAPALLRPLAGAGIAFETMDVPAACRTYNILALEGRDVAAALILD